MHSLRGQVQRMKKEDPDGAQPATANSGGAMQSEGASAKKQNDGASTKKQNDGASGKKRGRPAGTKRKAPAESEDGDEGQAGTGSDTNLKGQEDCACTQAACEEGS